MPTAGLPLGSVRRRGPQEGAPAGLAFRPFHMGPPHSVLGPLCSGTGRATARGTLLPPVNTHLAPDPSFSQMLEPTARLWTSKVGLC